MAKKNIHAVELGRRGGLKSRAGRMAKISPEERTRIARNAALALWAQRKAAEKLAAI